MKREGDEILWESLMTGDVSGAIMNQEKRGQDDLVRNEVLPKQCPRTDLEALGFVFGKDVDDLFVEVKFPAGWKKVATSHSMHSDLVDGKGRKRGSIFYKATFYDRKASVHLDRRYYARSQPINGYGDNYNFDDPRIGVVTDQDAVIWRTEFQVAHDAHYSLVDGLDRQAKAWLEEHYPDHENALAYWD